MAEHDDVVSMAGVSESTATVVGRPVAADETLMEPLGCEGRIEGSLCGEDEGEIMVEVLGSDVFVDGVGGQVGGGNWNTEEGGGELLKEGFEREMESVDGEGSVTGGLASQEVGALGGQAWKARIETRVDGFPEIVGLLDEQTHVAAEEVAVRVHEDGLDRGDDDSCVLGIETGVGCSLAISGSSRDQTEVVAERIVATDSEESLERGLVEEGMEKVTMSVQGGDGALGELPSQRSGVLDDELWNPGIGASVVCSSTVTQSSSIQTSVAAKEVAMMVNDESLNHKDQVPGSGAKDGNLTCSETDHSSVAEIVCVGRDKDGAIHLNAGSLNQQVEVTVGGEVGVANKEEILHPKGNLCCYVEDQQMKVETAGENTESQGNLHADPMPSSEPSMAVAGSESDNAVCAEQTKVVNDNEGLVMDSKVLNSNVEIPTTDTDRTVACSEDDKNMKCETICGIAGKDGHVLADLVSSNERACVTEIGEGAAMDVEEVLNIEGEAAGVNAFDGISSEKDQYLAIKMVDGSCENDLVHRDLDSSGKQTQIADSSDIVVMCKEVPKLEGEAMMKDGEKVSDSKVEVLDGDICLQKDAVVTLTVGGSMGNDGIAQGNAEASGEQIEIDNQMESSVLHCQGIVQVPACYTFEENIFLSEKAEELKVETSGKNSAEDPSSGVDSALIGDHSCSIRTCSDSLEDNSSLRDEKQETVAQLDDLHTHEVDGDQRMSMLNVDEASAQGVCAVALSNTVVKVNSDEVVNPEAKGESYKAEERVPEGQILNKMVGSLVVDLDACLNQDGKCKPQNESVKENVSSPDESQLIRDDVQAMGGHVALEYSECLDGSATCDVCLDDSSIGQEVEVQEQYTDAEQVDLCGGQEIEIGEQAADHEQAKGDETSKQTSLKPGSFAKVHQANYLLPPENEGEFSVSDLVWGKVKSHPWWPGQIFDLADASEKAMKYHKKDCFLVAYFGDRTFAWNEAALLKPFWKNFSHIEKQSNSEIFQNAVGCALEEVSRRVELGLACSCIAKDAYDKIESQIVQNTGIHQESNRRCGVDKSTGVSSFEPDKLVEYIRALSLSPSAGADRLELVIAKAQLLAFNRLKGYCQLPEFQFCGGLLENNTESSQLGEVIDHAPNDEQIFSSKGRLKTENSSSHKRKHNLKDNLHPRKKERSLSELMGDMVSSPDGEDGSDWKASTKSVLSSSGKKRKGVDFISDDSEVQDRRISIYAAKVSTTAPIPKPSFKVGECIRRVASQLTGSPSILKCSSEKFQKVDGSSEFDVSLQTPDNSQSGRMAFPMEYSSLDEMLSQLHLAARDPKKGYSFLTTGITFFACFRNSISLGQFSGRQKSSTGKLGGGRKKKASHAIIGSPEEFEFDDVNDSYWTDRIIQNNSEEQPSGDSPSRGQYQLVAFDPDKSLKSSRRPYSRKRFANGNHDMTIEEPIGCNDERKQDNSPTELIVNFSGGDSVPSEMNLNKIFRRFGPLKETETEVDLETSRARVVFKRGSDAEIAISSAGKFNIFGPMIVSYQLSYSPSISFKTLPLATSQGQEDAT